MLCLPFFWVWLLLGVVLCVLALFWLGSSFCWFVGGCLLCFVFWGDVMLVFWFWLFGCLLASLLDCYDDSSSLLLVALVSPRLVQLPELR